MNLKRFRLVALFLGLIAFAAAVPAKEKKVKASPVAPQDSIEVVGHVPLTNGPVSRFVATQHYSSTYLYAEHEAGKIVTLIDVTKVASPTVLADVEYPLNGASGSLFAVTGTTVLVTNQPADGAPIVTPETIRIMDFSDPRHPKVAREFAGVTALTRDQGRGLIFLANQEGIWILHQTFAEDPEVEKAYGKYVLYSH